MAEKADGSEPDAPAVVPGSEEKKDNPEAQLGLDALALEVGYELIPAVEVSMGGTLLDRIAGLRRQFAADLGVIVPPVRIKDNLALLPSEYRISILGTEIARGNLRNGRLLAMGEPQSDVDVPGKKRGIRCSTKSRVGSCRGIAISPKHSDAPSSITPRFWRRTSPRS